MPGGGGAAPWFQAPPYGGGIIGSLRPWSHEPSWGPAWPPYPLPWGALLNEEDAAVRLDGCGALLSGAAFVLVASARFRRLRLLLGDAFELERPPSSGSVAVGVTGF